MRTATRLVVLGRKQLWTPAALGSPLALWLDADDFSTITLNGSTVSQWRDKSGNGCHASQNDPARQPTYTANGLNGNVLTFDGVNDFLSFSVPVLSTTHSLFFVFTPTIENQTGTVFGQWTAGQTGRFLFNANQNSLGTTQVGKLNPFNSTATAGGGGGFAADVSISNTPTLITSISTTGSEQWKLFKNGAQWDSATITSVFTGVNSAIGSSNATGSLNPFDGAVSELVLFPSVLSTTDRQRLEGYLAHKRGLILASDHPFRFTPPYI
jgi:hypothetical protein